MRLKASDAVELRAALGLLNSAYKELSLHGVDLAGNRLIQAPPYNGSASVDWRFAHFDAGDLRLFVEGNLYGKQYFDAPNTERVAQKSYALVNARLTYAPTSKPGFGGGLWIKNLANREYLAYGLPQRDPAQGGLGFDYALVGEPRTFGVEVTFAF